jgi:hypothetical protein
MIPDSTQRVYRSPKSIVGSRTVLLGAAKLHISDRVEVSGQLSNQFIREEIYALWSMTRHFG